MAMMGFKQYLMVGLIGLGMAIAILFGLLGGNSGQANATTCQYNAESYNGLELAQLSQELDGNGLIGRIHGASATAKMVVLSVREPNNFFAHREFSLIAENDTVQAALDQLHRHDQVCVQGSVIANPSPQSHIKVSAIEVQEPWTGLDGHPDYEYEDGVPEELMNQSSFVGEVHAIGEGGKILVMEYKDRVLPIFVPTPEATQSLYRGDIVRLSYQIQQHPGSPMHLQLDPAVEEPIEIVDAIAPQHGEAQTLSGHLVQFPKSPQLRFDVYAIQVETADINRTFTLLNFNDMEAFEGIRTKLSEIWDSQKETVVTGRNYLINPDITIEASGLINVISPEQANPQILLENADALTQLQ